MLRSVYLKTLRDQRWAELTWVLVVLAIMATGYQAYSAVNISPSALQLLGEQFKYLADPVALGTADGFVTFRYGFFLSVIIAIWAAVIGARALRIDEARGTMDVLEATPTTRTSLILQKILAFGTLALVIGLALALGAMMGQSSLHLAVNASGALVWGLDLALFTFVFAMVGLFLSQFFATPGGAAGFAGGIVALSFIIDSAGRVNTQAAGWRYISPYFYFNLSKPLIADYGANPGALVVLLVLGLALAVASVALFAQRDINGVTLQLHTRHQRHVPLGRQIAEVERDPWLTSVLVRAVRAHAPAMGWWLLGIFVWGLYGTSIVTSTKQALAQIFSSSDLIKKLFTGVDVATNNGFLSIMVFLTISLTLVIYALIRASDWIADQDNGRVDMVLATPQPRWAVALETFAAMVVAFVAATLANWLGILIGAASTGLQVDAMRVLAASLAFLPPMLIIAGLVFALGSRLRSSMVLGIVGLYLGASFLVDLLRSFLSLPDWVQHLSIFSAYGQPIIDGIDATSIVIQLAIAAVLVAIGVTIFQTSDTRQGG